MLNHNSPSYVIHWSKYHLEPNGKSIKEMDTIYLKPELYLALLASEEYVDYLYHTKNNKLFIDVKKLPKDHYLSVNGDYAHGLCLCWKLNETQTDLVQVEENVRT